jgi:hypothetical protein
MNLPTVLEEMPLMMQISATDQANQWPNHQAPI